MFSLFSIFFLNRSMYDATSRDSVYFTRTREYEILLKLPSDLLASGYKYLYINMYNLAINSFVCVFRYMERGRREAAALAYVTPDNCCCRDSIKVG